MDFSKLFQFDSLNTKNQSICKHFTSESHSAQNLSGATKHNISKTLPISTSLSKIRVFVQVLFAITKLLCLRFTPISIHFIDFATKKKGSARNIEGCFIECILFPIHSISFDFLIIYFMDSLYIYIYTSFETAIPEGV